MKIEKEQILSKWIARILKSYFKEQKEKNTLKLFIKISGLLDFELECFLKELEKKHEILKNEYKPQVRLIKPLDGCEKYHLRNHETSIWLRNNTQIHEALIILINDITPESQSLENLFSIDEAFLLSSKGITEFFQVLSEDYNRSEEEIEDIKLFIGMYSTIAEPQLRILIEFIAEVLSDEEKSIVKNIQENLPILNLFQDRHFQLEESHKKRLNRNYTLANLTGNNSDIEKLKEKMYMFLDNEESNNYPHEIWGTIKPDAFREMALSYINKKNLDLLHFDFEIIESIFKFRSKTDISKRIKETLEYDMRSKKEQDEISEGIENILENLSVEDIQDFYDKNEDYFEKDSGLKKIVLRRIEKLRHPSEYEDLYIALLFESYRLLCDVEDKEIGDIYFNLSVEDNKLPSDILSFLNVYVKNIQNQIPKINYIENEIDEDSRNKLKEITFNYELVNDDKNLSKKFKLINIETTRIRDFIEEIEKNRLPKFKQYKDDTVSTIDIYKIVKDKMKNYELQQFKKINNEVKPFEDYTKWYSTQLKKAIKEGVLSLDVYEMQSKTCIYFKRVKNDVHITQHILNPLMEIGCYDECDYYEGGTGLIKERELTVFQPIRLLSYIKRYSELQSIINNWIERLKKDAISIEKENEYLEYVSGSIKNLSPRYFALDSNAKFLVEIDEIMGSGKFVLNNELMCRMDHISAELSEELVKTIKNYIEVYPYSKDSMDILFLYCQSAEIVIKSIEKLFKSINGLRKLRINVHSLLAAEIYKELNAWLEKKEEFSKATLNSKFPEVELNVFSGEEVNEIFDHIRENMVDTDIVVLADYFGQSDQVQFTFENIEPIESENWFEKIELEPLMNNESIKRLPFISERMPKTVEYFYRMQHMNQNHAIKNDLFVLKNTITVNNVSSHLIDQIHDKFNWVMIMDRFLDKSLLEKTSSKAQIIQYRSKAGKNKDYKIILSSSNHLKKLNKGVEDYEYIDRLLRKTKEIMKNEQIQKKKILEAVNDVKKISGALVLKAVGPGKYTHEMLSTYLAVNYKNRKKLDDEYSLTVWSLCDELPWFNSRKRRPDLVITRVKEIEGTFNIEFFIKELKFVNKNIFEGERIDAIKQISSAEKLYKDIFNFEEDNPDAMFWKDSLVAFLVERDAYNVIEADTIRKIQHTPLSKINTTINSSIDVYCYTDNLKDYEFAQVENTPYEDILDNKYKNYIFPRNYILDALGAKEDETPDYKEIRVDYSSESEKYYEENIVDSFIGEKKDKSEPKSPRYSDQTVPPKIPLKVADQAKKYSLSHYPEIVALKAIEIENETFEKPDYEEIKKWHRNKLTSNFSRNGINIYVDDVIVGSGVIRIVVRIPSTVSQNRITSKRKDIQLWLETSQEPTIRIDKGKINIDVVREDPETIYFENFMYEVRKQLKEKIKESNLIAPLGLNPLNQMIYIDLSDATTPHLLVGGTTGSGKSVSLNSIILSIMCIYSPEQVQFMFIDPKQVEFTNYNNKKHTLKVIKNIDSAVEELSQMVEEMENRYDMFSKEYVSNIDEYIKLTNNKMPHLVLVFDEFADFINQERKMAKRVEVAITRLGQKARAAGIHLIICTQHPKAEVINTNIRNNLGARLALRTADSVASNVILDQDGAERLAGKGDFLAKTSFGNIERGKSPFLTPKVKRGLLQFFEQSN